MFLQLPDVRCDGGSKDNRYNSAVGKAGSFEGTLPRCFFLRAVLSNQETQGEFFGFSVDSDFADGRYPEYRNSAPLAAQTGFRNRTGCAEAGYG